MIDLHSHILPEIDDGAATLDEALQLLRLAAADGVQIQVLTPHIHIGRYENNQSTLQQAFRQFEAQAREADIDIELRLSAEVRIAPEIMPMVTQDQLPWLGELDGKKVLLLEFPHSMIPVGSINLVKWLKKQGVTPLIAHPERNRELQIDQAKIEPYLAEGCLLQITASSLSGHFGPVARDMAETLLQAGKVYLLATDCHNLKYRPPDLLQGYRAAVDLLGVDLAVDLVRNNPARILGIEIPRGADFSAALNTQG